MNEASRFKWYMQEYVNTQYMKEHATTLKDYAKHKNAAMQQCLCYSVQWCNVTIDMSRDKDPIFVSFFSLDRMCDIDKKKKNTHYFLGLVYLDKSLC